MRRWFIAAFALHFFLSVGAFAFGHIDTHAPGGNAQPNPLAEMSDWLDPTQEGDLLGTAPDHGLTDSQPDLPDILKPVSFLLAEASPQPAPAEHRWVPPLSPTLEGPQRPPRARD